MIREKVAPKKPKLRQPMISKAGIVFEKQLMLDSGRSARSTRHSEETPKIANISAAISGFNPSKYAARYHIKHGGSFSPFKTVSRDTRNSYLLRVTCEPNVKQDYHINPEALMQSSPKFTVAKSSFERRIDYGYQVRDRSLQEPPVPIAEIQKRCRRSMADQESKRPLTVNDVMKWRKTHHDIDFAKQTSYKQEESILKSTRPGTHHKKLLDLSLDKLAVTRQSNFNNMPRFSTRPHAQKAHNFNSDSPHKFLEYLKQTKVPVFDLDNVKWQRLRHMWNGNRADLKFGQFRNTIAVRQDRSEQPWNPKLQYYPNHSFVKDRTDQSVSFNQELSRQVNQVQSKYPTRMTMRMDYGQHYYPELKHLSQMRGKKSVEIV